MPLHLAYRPEIFDEMVGNTETISMLKTLLKRREDMPHSLLFTGPSGCGKTTLARIVARELGARDRDLKEVDSADYRGIDSIRSILGEMKLKPWKGKYRVWILDEVHRLTGDAQSALLKALEDTPSHVFFILCTTDPQKLLATILSRCSLFKVKKLHGREILILLQEIAAAEDKTIPEDVLNRIVSISDGSPRVALVALDKIIDLPMEEMSSSIEGVLETNPEIVDLCRAVIKKEGWATISRILRGLVNEDPENVRRAVLGYSNTILLSKDDPRAFLIMSAFSTPFYDTGMAGLTLACYEALHG